MNLFRRPALSTPTPPGPRRIHPPLPGGPSRRRGTGPTPLLGPEVRGLNVEVLRPVRGGRGGKNLTAGCASLTLVAIVLEGPEGLEATLPRDWRVLGPHEKAPAAAVVIDGAGAHIEPIDAPDPTWVDRRDGAMFGGNYATTCDNRFVVELSEILRYPAPRALPVFDRYDD
ncbi:hypothetical protein [Nocardia paucivorans]|uniref:hypothetical protein n=1 Tax=Nocardia paucivorans TaxID=114259 RepID=UPI000594051C|nr:hypothetical protein [Nocardia paucivorans]